MEMLKVVIQQDLLKLLTILIPTRNRADFIIRLLEYYELLNFSGVVFIGDSSDITNYYQIQYKIKKIKKYKVIIHHYPEKSIREVMELMSKKITTSYAMFSGDDDLIIPSGAVKAVHFLQKNNDYIAAHGAGYVFNVKNNGPYGEMTLISRYPQPGLENSSPLERVEGLFNSYWVPLFSIFRTSNFLSIWRGVSAIDDITLGSELIPAARASILGKNKFISTVSLLRQAHDSHHHLPIFSELTARKGEGNLCELFVDECKQCMAELGVPIDISRQCLLRAFKSYMLNSCRYEHIKNNKFSIYIRGLKIINYLRIIRKYLNILILNNYLILRYSDIKTVFKLIEKS